MSDHQIMSLFFVVERHQDIGSVLYRRGLVARARFSEPIFDLNAEVLKRYIVHHKAQDWQLI